MHATYIRPRYLPQLQNSTASQKRHSLQNFADTALNAAAGFWFLLAGIFRTGVDRVRLSVVQVALHPSKTGGVGNLLVIGGGNRHFGHHGVPRFGGRRDIGLL
ncbi:MAG TPA: hypothetical protein VGR03_11290, partial [Candidatus Acidoferrum sp.]|nr:hypothetical protein [Candidatus Acidoferrum sp.]